MGIVQIELSILHNVNYRKLKYFFYIDKTQFKFMKVIWSTEAIRRFEEILNYLRDHFSEKEMIKWYAIQ